MTKFNEALKDKYVICRGYHSGVFFGKAIEVDMQNRLILLDEAINLYCWETSIGTGNISCAINSGIKSATFEKVPGGVVILTENYQVMPATDEQIQIVQSRAKDIL